MKDDQERVQAIRSVLFGTKSLLIQSNRKNEKLKQITSESLWMEWFEAYDIELNEWMNEWMNEWTFVFAIVSFDTESYAVTLANRHIFVVKTRNS